MDLAHDVLQLRVVVSEFLARDDLPQAIKCVDAELTLQRDAFVQVGLLDVVDRHSHFLLQKINSISSITVFFSLYESVKFSYNCRNNFGFSFAPA